MTQAPFILLLCHPKIVHTVGGDSRWLTTVSTVQPEEERGRRAEISFPLEKRAD